MSRKTHLESIELAQAYAADHPEIENLINSFVRMSEHPKAMCKISVGKYDAKGKAFTSKLISNIRFAHTTFTSCENAPQVLIKNHSENVCCINLTCVGKILLEKQYSVPKPLNYETETYIFSYCGDDYRFNITFEN